jgi:hypothetical protein
MSKSDRAYAAKVSIRRLDIERNEIRDASHLKPPAQGQIIPQPESEGKSLHILSAVAL